MPIVGICELLRDRGGDRCGHGFEFEHETAGILNRKRVLENLERIHGSATLHAKPAEHRHGVRREADVRSRRNPRIDERFENVGLALPALRLDRIAAGVLHETRCILQCAVDGIVALIRHASEHERVRRAAPHRKRVHDHHVHRCGDRVRMSMRNHRQAVADDRDVDAGLLGPACRRVVGDGHVDELLPGLLGVADLRDRALLAFLRHQVRAGPIQTV